MPSNVVRATLLADARRYQSGFRDAEQATQHFEGRVSKTGSILKGVLAGAAATAVFNFARDSIRAFSDLEQSIGSVESVFGGAADQITSAGDRAATQFGLSASDFNQSAALIGSQLKNLLGVSVDEAADKTQNLIGKASDLAATFGGTTSDAVSAIGSLLRGERDPIERYGVSMNEAMISARALELGLADAGTELSASAKATAALDLLNEQTADSTGQFARESETLAGKQQRLGAQIENTQALIGRALAPAMSGALDITGALTTAVADLALNMLVARGEITEAEKAITQYEAATGKAVESADDLIESLIEEGLNLERIAGQKGGVHEAAAGHDAFAKSVSDALAVLDPGIDVAADWERQIEAVGRELGLTKEQTAGARSALERYQIAEGNAARDAARHKKDHHDLGGAIGEVETEATEARTALQKYEDEVKSQIDPVFRLMQANDQVADAVQGVMDAKKEFGRKSPEYRRALRDLAGAELELKSAQIEVATQSGLTRSQFESQLRQMSGLTDEMIDDILADFDRVNRFRFNPKTIEVTHRVTGGGVQEFAEGGVVQGPYPGAPVPAIVHAGEIVTPRHRVRQSAGAGHGGGSQLVINVTAIDPAAAARAVIQAIQAYERMNGADWRSRR